MSPDPRAGSGPSAPGSRWFAVLAVLTVAFLAYGSFVPLHLAPRPLDEAWHVFRHAIPVRVNPSDLVANVLLMAPFPFFFLGALPASRTASHRAAAVAGAWLLSTLLTAAVEFGQVYFPPRHPSLVDIAAQSFGAGLGALAWLAWGPRTLAAWRRWKSRYGPASPAEWILWGYLAGVFLARVLPLDLTPSPTTLRYKWRAGRVALVPFSHAPEDPGRFVLYATAGIGLWIPVAVMLVLTGRTGALGAFLLTTGFAAAFEGVRLLVISRVSDVTDLVLAAVGAAVGAMLGRGFLFLRDRLAIRSDPRGQGASPRSPALAQPERDRPSTTTSAEKE